MPIAYVVVPHTDIPVGPAAPLCTRSAPPLARVRGCRPITLRRRESCQGERPLSRGPVLVDGSASFPPDGTSTPSPTTAHPTISSLVHHHPDPSFLRLQSLLQAYIFHTASVQKDESVDSLADQSHNPYAHPNGPPAAFSVRCPSYSLHRPNVPREHRNPVQH